MGLRDSIFSFLCCFVFWPFWNQKGTQIRQEPQLAANWARQKAFWRPLAGSTLGFMWALEAPFWEALGSPGEALGGILEGKNRKQNLEGKMRASPDKPRRDARWPYRLRLGGRTARTHERSSTPSPLRRGGRIVTAEPGHRPSLFF